MREMRQTTIDTRNRQRRKWGKWKDYHRSQSQMQGLAAWGKSLRFSPLPQLTHQLTLSFVCKNLTYRNDEEATIFKADILLSISFSMLKAQLIIHLNLLLDFEWNIDKESLSIDEYIIMTDIIQSYKKWDNTSLYKTFLDQFEPQ